MISGGTENHIILLDVFGSCGLSGKEAEELFESIGISTNKNMIPFDTRKPLDPSGIRIGTPAITTRGFNVSASEELARIMVKAIKHPHDYALHESLRGEVRALCERFPIPLYR